MNHPYDVFYATENRYISRLEKSVPFVFSRCMRDTPIVGALLLCAPTDVPHPIEKGNTTRF